MRREVTVGGRDQPPVGTNVRSAVPLAGYTTLRLGGPAARFVAGTTSAEVVAAVRDADRAGEPLLVLGGGSNLVVGDAGFDGTVVHVASEGTHIDTAEHGRVQLTVEAGANWDTVVAGTVDSGLGGLECLSGIPGSSARRRCRTSARTARGGAGDRVGRAAGPASAKCTR